MSLQTARITPALVFSREPQHQVSNLTPQRRTTGGTRARPSLGDQAPMPAQQRRWRDDEPSPTGARQESAGGAEQQAVNRGDRRPPRCPTEDRELVPRHDDFEFLELVRPNAQNHEIEKPAKQPVAPRHEHEASSIAGRWPNSTRQPTLMIFAGPGSGTGSEFMHPSHSRLEPTCG